MWCDWILRFIKRHSTVPGAVIIFSLAYILMLAVNAEAVGATWAQAVGTVAAVVAAIWTVRQQETREKREKLSQDLVTAKALTEMASQALHFVKRLGEKVSPNTRVGYEKEMVRSRLREFERIDLLSLPDVRMVDQVMIVVANLEFALNCVDMVENRMLESAAREHLEHLRTIPLILHGAWLNLRILQGQLESHTHLTALPR